MAPPIPVLRVDWRNAGVFTDALSTVHPIDSPAMTFGRGRSGDFTADATGQLAFTLDNTDFAYTPDRNWHDNPSFEVDTTGWSVAAATGFALAGTSITKVADNAPSAGIAAGEVILPATLGAGATYALPYRFRAGQTYAVSVWLKSMSGSLAIQAGIGAAAPDPLSDLAHLMPEGGAITLDGGTGAGTITTSWAAYTFTWTPYSDQVGATLYLIVTAAAAATFRIDAIQVNPGTSANAYLEAPTKGQLVPGRPVHLYATYGGTSFPLFYGFLERITPDLDNRVVTFTAYDVLRKLAETDVVVPANPFFTRTARDSRIAVLEDYERGTLNLLDNPTLAGLTTGNGTAIGRWGCGSQSRMRILTNDPCPAGGQTIEWTTGTGGTPSVTASVYLAPVTFAGAPYRFSVYLRAPAAPAAGVSAKLIMASGSGATIGSATVTVTPTWKRFSVVGTPTSTSSASSQSQGAPNLAALTVQLFTVDTTVSSLIRFAGPNVTRGQGLLPFTAAGTGRWANYCGSGSFDGGGLNGWYDSWTNLCTNGSFEVDTTGWVGATRVTTEHAFGVASCQAAGNPSFALVGTFRKGQSYTLTASLKGPSGGYNMRLESIGTPADFANVACTYNNSSWTANAVTWTPTADYTDARLRFTGSAGTDFIDGVAVTLRDAAASADPAYSDTGPAGGGSFLTTRAINATLSRWGTTSQQLTTPATATAGRVYDFFHIGAVFVSGQAYTASLWLNPSITMPYKVGLGANAATGLWDEATTTGTAIAGTWTQITVTWTPTADAIASVAFRAVLSVLQTDAVVRTFNLDGVRVIPGSTADNFEQPYWDIPGSVEAESYGTGAAFSGTASSILAQINAEAYSRHWITADMASPFYRYKMQDRTAYAANWALERYTDAQATTAPELDRQAIVNLIPFLSTQQDYFSDEASVAAYGLRPTGSINGANGPSATLAATIGASGLTRYAQPIRRPTFSVENRWPSQLMRDVNDGAWLAIDPWLVRSLFGNIARVTTTVDNAGQHWKSDYQLEESNVPDGGYGSLAMTYPEA